MHPVGFIGAGRASQLLVGAWQTVEKHCRPEFVFWTRSSETALEFQKNAPGARRCSVEECLRECEFVYLAIPSAAMVNLFSELTLASKVERNLLSLCAGVSQLQLSGLFPSATVVRLFPSLGCQIGRGVIAAYHAPEITGTAFARVLEHLAVYGETVEFDSERRFIETCPPICFSALLLQILAIAERSMQSCASNKEDCASILRKCFTSTAQLFSETQLSYEDGVRQIATPGGITERGIRALESATPELSKCIEAMYAAVARL